MALYHDAHASDDLLERYAMGHATPQECEKIEEHLLICARCQQALASTADYVGAMRAAAIQLRQEEKQPRQPLLAPIWRPLQPAWSLALAALLVCLIGGMTWYSRHTITAPAVVVLESMRGPTNSNSAPSGTPLTLLLDLTGLPPAAQYNLEIVDDSGHPVFESTAIASGRTARATVPARLSTGDYYVRLYAPGRQLLREFSLHAGD
jgi:hypothetical protein